MILPRLFDLVVAIEGRLDVIAVHASLSRTGVLARPTAARDWLCWQVIHSAAGYLSEAFVQEDFDFYGRTLSGTPPAA